MPLRPGRPHQQHDDGRAFSRDVDHRAGLNGDARLGAGRRGGERITCALNGKSARRAYVLGGEWLNHVKPGSP